MPNSLNSMIPIGVRFMVLSAFGFALMSATVKHVSLHGIPVFEIVAARALVSLVISYLDVKRKGISVWGNNKPLLFARGAVGTMALMCVYYSVTTLPLAEATIFSISTLFLLPYSPFSSLKNVSSSRRLFVSPFVYLGSTSWCDQKLIQTPNMPYQCSV